MLCNSKCFMLLLTTIFTITVLPKSQAVIYSNSTGLEPNPDDTFCGLPVYFKSNTMIKSLQNKDRMHEHIQRILRPLAQYILSEDVKVYGPQRRADYYGGVGGASSLGGNFGGIGGAIGNGGPESVVQVEQYDLPFISAAQIGTYTYTCRQSNGDLVIYNPTLPVEHRLRSIPSFTELQTHPKPGVWWWVQCVTFETGGAGMGISGVQKPGGDAGIDPNALKSLVG